MHSRLYPRIIQVVPVFALLSFFFFLLSVLRSVDAVVPPQAPTFRSFSSLERGSKRRPWLIRARVLPQIIDFGLSRFEDMQSAMTTRVGTPYYIAPEVLSRKYDKVSKSNVRGFVRCMTCRALVLGGQVTRCLSRVGLYLVEAWQALAEGDDLMHGGPEAMR